MGRAAGQLMLTLFNQAKAKCPSQRVFFSGYSQGAMVVHNVMGRLSADQAASVGVRSYLDFADARWLELELELY